MNKSVFIKAILITAVVPLFAGCIERQVVYVPQPAPAGTVVVAQPSEPPPPQVEVVPAAPDPTYIWIGGNWEWRGSWVWVNGYWGHRPYVGAVWVHGRWGWHGHRRVWVRAGWR